MTASDIARACGGRQSGSGWIMRCPAHEDHDPSCSITEADGRVLVHCHAGCRQDDVVGALRERGLWPDSPLNDEDRIRQRSPLSRANEQRRVVAEYTYTDEFGVTLYQVLRYEPGRDGRKKDFAQRRPDGQGGWIWKKHPKQILYRLPEVAEAAIVFVVEGEKDVETLREHGFVATCNAGGAGKWRPEFNAVFAGKSVVVIPDRDPAGFAHARAVVEGVGPYAANVVIVDLEDAKDISDWFASDHFETELIELLETAWTSQEVAQHGPGH